MNITEDYIFNVSVPEKTLSYTPVPHQDLINSIQTKIAKKNLIIADKSYMVNNGGNQLIGKYALESGDTDMRMMLGFRNSYDKSMAIGFATGAQIVVCSNGMLSGDLTIYRKHTGNVLEELHDYIIDSINMVQKKFTKLKEDAQKLKLLELSNKEQAEILGRLYIEEDLITSTQLNIIKRELVHSENFVGKNAWCLYNNITESFKVSHASTVLQDHLKLHAFFEKEILV